VDAVKGPAGTVVSLTIVRGTQVMTKSITRKMIHIEFVNHQLLDENSYYIDLDSFGAGSAKAFSSALDAFLDTDAEKLIIDVRNNPG
jgi:carboxyl-terminal processing protease